MKRRFLSILVALAMCVSLLPTVALADLSESDLEGGNPIVFDGGGTDDPADDPTDEPTDDPTDEPTDEKETKDSDEKDEKTDPDKGQTGKHECIFVDGRCECGKEEPAALPPAQPLGAYALRTAGEEPEGEPAAQDEQAAVSYIGADGKTENCETYTPLTSETTTSLDAGWYVVSEDATISGTLTVSGETHLILCDGATLTLKGGLKGESGAKLHIYGQTNGTGKLDVSGDAGSTNGMAIYMSGDSGELVINGGVVTAELREAGNKNLYGIYVSGTMTVNGGEVTAIGGEQAANETTEANTCIGIRAKEMTVNGGKVTATGGIVNYGSASNPNDAHGCESTGIKVKGSTMTVNGGEVTAKGSAATTTVGNSFDKDMESYGIYMVDKGITINGGTVTATSGELTVQSANGGTGSTSGASRSYGVYLSNSETLRVSGMLIAASGAGDHYDIVCKEGNMVIPENSAGKVLKMADGGAVKVLIGGSLYVRADEGEIQLAEGSKITTSIIATSKEHFNALVAGGCWYFKDDTNAYSDGDIKSSSNEYIMSADSGEGKHILIKESNTAVSYLGANGTMHSCVSPTKLTNTMTNLSSGWYVVSENVTFSNTLTVSGEAYIILKDNATLKLNGGLKGDDKLHIYGQSKGENVGKMVVSGEVAAGDDNYAAICMTGTLEINSGKVTATGNNVNDKTKESSFGIYMYANAASELVVKGGELTATGGEGKESYGIYHNSSGNLSVKGGKVTATGGEASGTSCGIYKAGNGCNILIQGGELEAKGGTATAGSSYGIYTSCSMEVSNGTVTATGGEASGTNDNSYGINARQDATVTVSGGTLEAKGGTATKSSYGIYANAALTVSGGTLKAKGGTATKSSYGIYANAALTVSGKGELTAIGGDKETATGGTSTEANVYSHGIQAGANLTVSDTGKLTATGGEANSSYGIYTAGNEQTLTVSGKGELTAIGGTATTGTSNGIRMQNSCSTEVTGGRLEATGGTVDSDVNDTELTANGSFGIYAQSGGSFTVSGGELIAKADTATFTGAVVTGCSVGIYFGSNGSVEVTGGELTASGEAVKGGGNAGSGETGQPSGAANATSGGIVLNTDDDTVTVNVNVTANGGKLTATGGEATGVASAYSYGISCASLTVENEGTTVQATSYTFTGGAQGVSYGINSNLTLSGGTVQGADGGAVLLCANAADGAVNVSGGSMKLAQDSVMKKINVSNVKLLDLVNEGYAYQKTTDSAFEKAVGATELTDVIVKPCETHSTNAGVCDYCGYESSPAPTPGGEGGSGEGGGSSSGGSSSGGSSGGGSSATTTTYSVSSSTMANGALTVSTENAKKGDIVTITVNPESGYTLETLQVLDENGNEIPLIDNGDGTYSFEMPAGEVEVQHTFAEDNSMLNFFADVPADAYYYDAALWAAKKGITGGIDENHFGPDLSCTRAQLVTFLWRAANKPAANGEMNFTDVQEDAYYSEAIRWAASLGIVSGYGNGLFGTGDTITREQMAVILYRFAQAMGLDTTQGGMAIREFADYESISPYALEAMQWAVNAGILHGYNNTLMPDQPCSRAQIVAMLYRMLGQA